jgi:hypothetical protein
MNDTFINGQIQKKNKNQKHSETTKMLLEVKKLKLTSRSFFVFSQRLF